MSNNPNDPFANPNAAPGPNQLGPNQGNVSYADNDFAQQPRKRGGTGLLIGCGLASLLGLLVCCGGFAMLGYFGMGAVAQLIQAEVENSPTVIEHFGQIESMTLSMSGTTAEAQNIQPGQGSPLAFDVVGSIGSGQIIAVQSTDGQGISSAVLVTADGTRFPIELTGGLSDFEDLDFDSGELIETGTAEEEVE